MRERADGFSSLSKRRFGVLILYRAAEEVRGKLITALAGAVRRGATGGTNLHEGESVNLHEGESVAF